MANVVQSPVESMTFQENISKIFTELYDEQIASKASAAYQKYIESKSDEFELIKKDVLGHDDDPTKSALYNALLEVLQTEEQFVSDKDKEELYRTLLAALDGVILSCMLADCHSISALSICCQNFMCCLLISIVLIAVNQPWNLKNHQRPKKKGSAQKDEIQLQSPHYAASSSTDSIDSQDVDDEKYDDSSKPKNDTNTNVLDDVAEDDEEALSDLEN